MLDVLAHTQPTILGLADVLEVFFQPLIQKLPNPPYDLLDLQISSHECLCLPKFLLPYVLIEPHNMTYILWLHIV